MNDATETESANVTTDSAEVGVDVIARIRHCANTGIILGTREFQKQYEPLTGDSSSCSG